MRIRFIFLLTVAATILGAQEFHLKDGDKVVFFGDSITDQRLYTTFTETYVVTRFPKWNVNFVHSGWGGDRVSGGGGGGIKERLTRDVLAYKPNVVTIMLGMNDGRYRAFDPQIFQIYSNGYKQIVQTLKTDLPGVRITAIQPSPYDDVTREPTFAEGYNSVLLQFSKFIGELAVEQQINFADLNRPVTAMLERAKAASPETSQRIIPDRVHPGASGHLIMASALLKAWNAPSLVSAVEIDASEKRVTKSEGTAVLNAMFGRGVSWMQKDDALPVPVDMNDAVMALAVKSSDFMDSLNRMTLKVNGLAAGKHTLRIDGDEIATFTADELRAGVNLAQYKSPMYAQAARVHALTLKHNNIHFARWRSLQVPMQTEQLDNMTSAITALDAVEGELIAQQHQAAQTVPHRFELTPNDSAFKKIFDGNTLTGWHISQVNHHGKTEGWKVENGVITGTQDKPGHGGVLLTDRKYKNFEVTLEVNPDYGCDSGLFLRATEKGEGYQVLLDYLDGGTVGGIYGEKLKDVTTFIPKWQEWFRRGEWNHIRARIEGDVPHIQVWMNGIKITDWKDTGNHLPGGAVDGMVAVQVHGGNRWIPGGKHRFRNIAVRELLE